MTDIESESELPDLQAEGVQPVGIGRRRLLRAGLAATPVVLAVSGRSAMAQDLIPCGNVLLSAPTWASVCSTGTFIANSHHATSPTSARLGLSPSNWKPNSNPNGQTFQAAYRWPIPPFTKIKATDGKTTYVWASVNYLQCKNIANSAAGWASGTRYSAVFGTSDGRSFSRILLDENGTLKCNLCAAYLNAMAMNGSYVMKPAEVVFLAVNRKLVQGGSLLTDGQINAFLSQTWA